MTLLLPIVSKEVLAQEGSRPKFDIGSLQVAGVALMPSDGKPAVGVGLGNSSDTEVWATVTIEEGKDKTACAGGKAVALAPKKRVWVGCAVSKVAPDVEYPITIAVFADDKASESAGSREIKARFRQSDIEWLQAQLQPLVFPLKMPGVVLSESVSLFAAMGGTAGELVVNEQGLQYTNPEKTLAIPTAQMRAVKPSVRRDHWIIVVEYRDGEENKTAVFQRSYGRGTHEGLDLFLRGLMTVYKPKPAAPAQ